MHGESKVSEHFRWIVCYR